MNKYDLMQYSLTYEGIQRIKGAIQKAINNGWVRELPNGELELTEKGKDQALRDMVVEGGEQ